MNGPGWRWLMSAVALASSKPTASPAVLVGIPYAHVNHLVANVFCFLSRLCVVSWVGRLDAPEQEV